MEDDEVFTVVDAQQQVPHFLLRGQGEDRPFDVVRGHERHDLVELYSHSILTSLIT